MAVQPEYAEAGTAMAVDRVADVVQEAVVDAMAESGVPGACVGVADADGAVAVRPCGVTSVDHPTPVGATTMFQIGSVSKLYTTLAVMRLAERGLLDLDRPIRTWVPGLRLADEAAAAGLTVRHLLQHTGGWRGDYNVDTGRGDDALERMLPVIEAAPALTPLGQTFHYNNLGFVLLGHVAAVVAGKPFETVVQEGVIEPLGLRRTGYFLEDLAFEHWAAGHVAVAGEQVVSAWARPRSRGPNGGVLSSIEGVLEFGRFHLGDGRTPAGDTVLSSQTMESMLRPSLPTGGLADSMCLGWMFDTWGSHGTIGHGGATLGFKARLAVVPEASIVLAILTNSSRGHRLVRAGLRAFRTTFLGDAGVEREPLTGPSAQALAGRFEAGIVFECDEDGCLVATFGAGPEADAGRVAEVAPDCFEVISGPGRGVRFDLLRKPDGSVAWLRHGGRLRAPRP